MTGHGGLRRGARGWAATFALLALVLQAYGPLLAARAAAGTRGDLVVLCTAHGARAVVLPDGGPPAPDDRPAPDAAEAHDCCLAHAPTAADTPPSTGPPGRSAGVLPRVVPHDRAPAARAVTAEHPPRAPPRSA